MSPEYTDRAMRVFRDGFAPSMSRRMLEELRDACRRDDTRLLQGATTQPPPLMCVQDWICEGGCAISLAGWMGLGLKTVGEVEECFARLCFEADARLGEPAACRWFLNWFDDTPRKEALALLADMIDGILECEIEAVIVNG